MSPVQRLYRVSFSCDERQLPTIVAALTREVRALTIAELERPKSNGSAEVVSRAKDPPQRFDNTENTRSGKIVLAILRAKKLCTGKDFTQAMIDAGFQPHSYSPVLSRLRVKGLVESLGSGQWRLKP